MIFGAEADRIGSILESVAGWTSDINDRLERDRFAVSGLDEIP